MQHCANCHGKNGEGLKYLYPPVKNSDYLVNKNKVLCLIKNGGKGPITVNGKVYDEIMPKNAALYNLDIAQIATYIFTNFGNSKNIIDTQDIEKLNCEPTK